MTERAAAAPRAAQPAAWSGLLPVDKPAGVTSHDVVAHARRRLRQKSVGHLGTLDPGASGLLVLALGAATRCAALWQGGTKTYEGTARFGLVTDTQDTEGQVTARHDPAGVDEPAVRAAAAALSGDLLQVPPMVSALKHRGERLYELARRGETVTRAPRPVHVEGWEWLGFALPDAHFRVRCSGGTYVRTLVHDLGAALGCGAALAALRRTRSEPFTVDAACPWAALAAPEPAAVLDRHGIALDRALDVLPAVVLDADGVVALGHGRAVPVAPGDAPVGAGARSVVLRDAAGRALALGELEPAAGAALARPHVVFPWAVRGGGAA